MIWLRKLSRQIRQFLQVQLAQQQQVLETFHTKFDIWFSERSLHESGAVEHGLEKLRKQGHVFEEAGAVWLRTTDFGDDKDRVIVKEDGDLTYFASDTAYYINKRERGFDIITDTSIALKQLLHVLAITLNTTWKS
jgi:arginyl-tRNA synthetase